MNPRFLFGIFLVALMIVGTLIYYIQEFRDRQAFHRARMLKELGVGPGKDVERGEIIDVEFLENGKRRK